MSVRRFFCVSMLKLMDKIFAILRSTAYFICTDVWHVMCPYPVSVMSGHYPDFQSWTSTFICVWFTSESESTIVQSYRDVSRSSWVKPVITRGLSVFAQGQNRPFDPKSTTEPLKAHLWLALIFSEYWKVTSQGDRSYNCFPYEI